MAISKRKQKQFQKIGANCSTEELVHIIAGYLKDQCEDYGAVDDIVNAFYRENNDEEQVIDVLEQICVFDRR